MCSAIGSTVETVKIIDFLLAGCEMYLIIMCIVKCERIGLICEMHSFLWEKVYYADDLIMKTNFLISFDIWMLSGLHVEVAELQLLRYGSMIELFIESWLRAETASQRVIRQEHG